MSLKAAAMRAHVLTSPQVADFGLSSSTTTGSGGGSGASGAAGPVTHLAPEVLQGRPPARQADVFAFGVLLWEL